MLTISCLAILAAGTALFFTGAFRSSHRADDEAEQRMIELAECDARCCRGVKR